MSSITPNIPNVRTLNTSDLFAVLRIATKAFDDPLELAAMFDGESVPDEPVKAEDDPEGNSPEYLAAVDEYNRAMGARGTRLFWAILTGLIGRAEDDVVAWLASLTGSTKADLLEADIETVPIILEAVSTQEAAPRFFARVSRLLGYMPTEGNTVQ